jgi:hypothetical protein
MGSEGSVISEKSVKEIKTTVKRLDEVVHSKNP